MSKIVPTYYRDGGADVISMLSEVFTPEEFRGFMKGNIIKYTVRYDKKNGMEDLNKAEEYRRRLTEWEALQLKKEGN